MEYGSDLIVETLRALEVEYVALNPGSSFRGIHDSIVNYAANRPQLITCCHEEIAVAVAHGYARVAGRPMAVLIHDVVGLMHASMAILNAWADRVPILLLGGAGPLNATKRRPWIDWFHTAQNQGELVREYVKWEEQPASLEAVPEAMLRAYRIAMAEPRGPVYLSFDASLQEAPLPEGMALPPVNCYPPPSSPQADPQALRQAARMLAQAPSPLIIADLLGRDARAGEALIELAELLGAPVIDRLGRFNFPNTHPLDLTGAEEELLPQTDVILALDVQDLYGALSITDRVTRQPQPVTREGAVVITISLADVNPRSWWGGDCQRLFPVNLAITADTALALPALIAGVKEAMGDGARPQRLERLAAVRLEARRRWQDRARQGWDESPVAPARLVAELWQVIKEEDWVLAQPSTAYAHWARHLWQWREPYRYAGRRGAAGLGLGLGLAIGAALAHRNSRRLCIDLQPDGDLLYTPGSLWTAAHLQLPLLIVMFNNRSYYNDEEHQEKIALARGRSPAHRGIGTRVEEPPVDFAAMARSFGVYGEGPLDRPGEVRQALTRALAVVKGGAPALVDVVTQPR